MNSTVETLTNNSMKRHLLLLIFLFSVVNTLPAQEFLGTWQFNAITSLQGDTLIEIAESDYMDINSDGTFHYELEAKNKLIADGAWKSSNNLLCFTYSLPTDTIRCYATQVNGNELILNEANINFSFIVNRLLVII